MKLIINSLEDLNINLTEELHMKGVWIPVSNKDIITDIESVVILTNELLVIFFIIDEEYVSSVYKYTQKL